MSLHTFNPVPCKNKLLTRFLYIFQSSIKIMECFRFTFRKKKKKISTDVSLILNANKNCCSLPCFRRHRSSDVKFGTMALARYPNRSLLHRNTSLKHFCRNPWLYRQQVMLREIATHIPFFRSISLLVMLCGPIDVI